MSWVPERAEVSTGDVAACVRPRMSAVDRREQFVAIGLELLESRPIHEFSLDEVAAAAGVSRTLVFHYFPTKSDYYAAVVASAGQRLLAFSDGQVGEDVESRLRDMVRGFLTLISRKHGAYVALVRGASGGDPKVLALLDDLRAALVGRWLEAAAWPERGPLTELAVRGWLGALEEVALSAQASHVPQDSVVELLSRGLIADLQLAAALSRAS